jgi:PHD/YefM family antitoxin component YafN of YafNO toxin-antitoxin module
MQMFRSQDLPRQASAIQEAALKEPVIIIDQDRPRFVLMTMQEYDRLRGRRVRSNEVLRAKG